SSPSMRRSRRCVSTGAIALATATIWCATSSVAFGQAPATSPQADALLARPVSPGAVALLVEISAVPAAQARLSAALADSDPDVRAAAARVIFVSGLRSLIPAVASALADEGNGLAAFEEARAVAYFGAADQETVIRQALMRLELENVS